ncbi:carboxymuconolactone decarboxylase family protein [Nannocystis pusilla]|uniref:Carboxymuconolactone decarboxylase family protein n=1 Tax=Nannocystis pusilla TaxID=889268 RepID=A0A9X3J2B1_9BACT|nr:carboxymuconolactone decarboxylase family protein [Nannocystis pusilla]MCY1012506.1 carboxymuconolactone decarboxylase family protein [Nannocystis pusilla]
MTMQRFDYTQLSPEVMQGFYSAHAALLRGPLGRPLIDLVYLRVSQINGCAYCLEMHSKSLRDDGETTRRIDVLAGWRVSTAYTPRERAALEWVEAVTDIAHTHAPDASYDALAEHFSERETSDLTTAIALMNALNRVAIAARR